MKKEEALIELAQLINKLRNECLTGDRYLPMCDVRRYNELVHGLWGDELGEDPEILEALSKKEKTTKKHKNQEGMSERARLARNAYQREWRSKNKGKVREINMRYWDKQGGER